MAKEFKTIEDAQKAFDSVNEKYAAEVESHKKTKAALAEKTKSLEAEKEAHKATKKELKVAEEIANDAIAKANQALSEASSEGVVVTIGKAKYRINFGVEGFSKEELKDQKELLAKLVKAGSGALSAVN